MPQPACVPAPAQVEYRARIFHQSPLYRVLYDHYASFQESYPSRFQGEFGLFRKSVDRAIDRFLICGDPREGVAVFACESCATKKIVPFSCKTRLFCPTCHSKRVLLWVEKLQENILSQVPHRFWTFSIPKRLRPYFMYDRGRLGLLTYAAHRTFALVLGNGAVRKDRRSAVIALIQTHGDELNWNAHLHLIAADGAFDLRNPQDIRFLPTLYWDVLKMAEIFRFVLIDRMHKEGILSDDVATNLMSWAHSGFHVHASEAFSPSDSDQFARRLAYAYRTPVSLSQMSYGKDQVYLRTKKGSALQLSPLEFIAKLTLHIPDTYLHMRRYAGLYASATRRKLGLKTVVSVKVNSDRKLSFSWSTLISRIFGQIPTKCPRCGETMKLLGFQTRIEVVRLLIPDVTRAPPPKPFTPYLILHAGKPFLEAAEGVKPYGHEWSDSQLLPESAADFDQRISEEG